MMWRNCVDVIALSNLLKTEIDIVVLDEDNSRVEQFSFKPDDKFKWNTDDKFKPNFEGERLNGKMTILNYKNRHFNLIIDKNHALFQVGSLKFQQEKFKGRKKLIETLFEKNTTVNKTPINTELGNETPTSEKVVKEKKPIDSIVNEHIHCHREENSCLDKKCESELDQLKKELDEYKLALREELQKRSKAEDMLKGLQTIQNINLTENIPKNLNTT